MDHLGFTIQWPFWNNSERPWLWPWCKHCPVG